MEQFLAYLDRQATLWTQESRKLAADDRKDESDLAKVRVNVYGICKSVFQVVGREKTVARLENLRKSWEASLAAARAHDDVKKAVIEEVKLTALNEIEIELRK